MKRGERRVTTPNETRQLVVMTSKCACAARDYQHNWSSTRVSSIRSQIQMLSDITTRLPCNPIGLGQNFVVASRISGLQIGHGSPRIADRIVQKSQTIKNHKDGAAFMAQHRQR